MFDIPTTIKNEKLVKKRREQILRAAIRVFARKGFHTATMRELSKAAKISHGNIYDYFGNKEDIFFMIHDFIGDRNDQQFDEIIKSEEDPLQKLQRMIDSEFRLMSEWADAILLLYQETHILSKNHLRKLLQRERDHVHRYEIILEEGIRAKQFRPVNVRVMANLIKVMVDSWIFKGWDIKSHADQNEMEKEILDLVFRGLLRAKK